MINEIDPRIYNFKNLKLEDQVVVASQFKIFLLVKKEKEDLKETADKQNSLTKFLYEVAIEELDEVEEKIKVTIIQTIISFIENYDYFVKELETDDYFYGLEMSKTIHDMTYTYINPETKKPTDVPTKHYQDILKQPVEVMVEEQVKRQFLNVMFKQLKNLKEEEPHLFYQSLLLMDIGKSPDSLAVNEEVALKMTSDYMIDEESKPKKKNEPKFHISQDSFIKKYNEVKNDDSIMAELFDSSEVKNEGFSLN